MRRIVWLTLLHIMTVCVSGQTISHLNAFRWNDVLLGNPVSTPDLDVKGDNAIWDFCNLQVSDGDHRVEYTMADKNEEFLVSSYEQGTRYTYDMYLDSVLITAFENKLSKMNYDLREAYLHFPMQYGDSLTGLFHGTGRYCDLLALRNYGRYTTKADAKGSIILAENDTLKDVLRLHTIRILATKEYPIERIESLGSYTADSINLHLATDTALIRVDIYRWYADGYRYPVLETRIRSNARTGEEYSSFCYYYPPEEQATLSYDPGNEQKRTALRGSINGKPVRRRRISQGTSASHINSDSSDNGLSTDNKHIDRSLCEETISDTYTVSGYHIDNERPNRNGVYLQETRTGQKRHTKKMIIRKK